MERNKTERRWTKKDVNERKYERIKKKSGKIKASEKLKDVKYKKM